MSIWGLNAQRKAISNISLGAGINAQCVHTLCTEARKRASGGSAHAERDKLFHLNHSPSKTKAKAKSK